MQGMKRCDRTVAVLNLSSCLRDGQKGRAPAAQKSGAALTRRPYFLSASSLFAACCLPASSSSPCC
ncbi:hypothetical protein, partial [Klebsiella pneumoniae]|uniref:hypothetical protein n=1 Tax=Klebsiella pneumoniae TaxID=573 RepID=UPI001C4DF641